MRAGRKLFLEHCANCHGSEARGGRHFPNLTAPEVSKAPAGAIVWFLKNGDLRRGMPSWSRMPDERLWQVATYLNSLSAVSQE